MIAQYTMVIRPSISIVALLLATIFAIPNAHCQDGEDAISPPKDTPPIITVRVYQADKQSGEKTGDPINVFQGAYVESNGTILTTYRQLADLETNALYPIIEIDEFGRGARKDLRAKIVALEPTLNFSILKVPGRRGLRTAKVCPRDDIQVDLPVHTMRMSNGDPKFASGKVSALNSMECYQESMTATMLQAKIDVPDACIGGPVFDDKGQIVAMHTGYIPSASEDPEEEEAPRIEEGHIHILPSFLIFNIYESVKLKGNMKSPWTGFSVRPLTEEEEATFPQGKYLGGVGIDYVWEGSPADRNGVKKGDMLVGFSYYPTKSVAAFQKWLYMYGVDFKVKLHFLRNESEYYSYEYTIEERPDSAKPR